MINRIDKVEPFLVIEGVNKTVEVLTDLLLVEASTVSDVLIEFGELALFEKSALVPAFRLPYDIKSVTMSSPDQKDTNGIFFNHSLTIQVAGTKADFNSEIESAVKRRYYVFFKSSVSGWQFLPTYTGASMNYSFERFPKRSSIRLTCQSLHAVCFVPDAIMEMILTP